MKDIMLDIETLGTLHNSVITQIGMLYFDRLTGELGKELLVNIRIQDCIDSGLRVDGGALKFWFEQENKSFLKNPVTLSKALECVRTFYDKQSLVWAHSTFDFPLLSNAYSVIGQGFALPYRNLRDIRTLVDLSGLEYIKKEDSKDPKTHNAMEDCKYQVVYCVECFKKLKER